MPGGETSLKQMLHEDVAVLPVTRLAARFMARCDYEKMTIS
jgi:hypothetical protein